VLLAQSMNTRSLVRPSRCSFKRFSLKDFDDLPEEIEVNEGRLETDRDYKAAFEFVQHQEDGMLAFDEEKFMTSRQYRNAVNLLAYPDLEAGFVLKNERKIVIGGVPRSFSLLHVKAGEGELVTTATKITTRFSKNDLIEHALTMAAGLDQVL